MGSDSGETSAKGQGCYRPMLLVFFLIFGAGWAVGGYLGWLKLQDPDAVPDNVFPQTEGSELHVVIGLGAVVGGGSLLMALSMAYAWLAELARGKPAPDDGRRIGAEHTDPERPTVPISPSFLAQGRTGLRALYYVPPETAASRASSCGAVTGIVVLAGVASLWVWPLHWLGYVFFGVPVVSGIITVAWSLRAWLAAKRLQLRFLDLPERARPGDGLEVQFEVVGRNAGRVDSLLLVLGCVKEEKRMRRTLRRSGSSWRTYHEVLYYHPLEFRRELELEEGDRKRLRAKLQVPEDALPTRDQYSDKVCWIVGLVADVPGWPDYELAREVVVEA